MEIEAPELSKAEFKQIREDLELLLEQPAAAEVPPCQNCEEHKAYQCSPKCPEAPRSLSIEPDRYPLEAKVVPFVFALRTMRLMQTCWSCEGHMNPEGEIWKTPQISFYSTSSIYPKLLINHIGRLKSEKKLAYEWRIVLSDYGQKPWAVTYTVEPILESVDPPRLGALQGDLLKIGEDLADHIANEARSLLRQISSA